MMTLSWTLRAGRLRPRDERRVIDAVEGSAPGPRVGEPGGEDAPDLLGVSGEIEDVAETRSVPQAAGGLGGDEPIVACDKRDAPVLDKVPVASRRIAQECAHQVLFT